MPGPPTAPRAARTPPPRPPALRLESGKVGLFNATVLVMGGIVGAGILIHPQGSRAGGTAVRLGVGVDTEVAEEGLRRLGVALDDLA